MPIPKPREDEKEQEFIGRCMADEGMVKEYEQEQRAAICYSTWKAKDKETLHCGHPEDHQDGDPDKPLLAEHMNDHPSHQKVIDQTLSEVKDGLVRIALAYTGDYERNGKSFSISLDDLKSMMKNLQKREIPLDYEHLSANPDAPPGHSRASGWLKAPDRIEDFGPNRKVLWGWAEFTGAALMAIRHKEFKYFSPEIHWTDTDEQGKHVGTRLAAGAVTNRPFLKDLPPIEIGATEFPALLEAVALSEHKRLINVGDVHVPADMNRSKRKEEGMAKFKLKKITSGDDKGKHGIFDGDQMVGVADAGTLEDYANELHADELDELKKLKASKKMKADDGHDDDSCPNSDELKKLRLRVGDGPIQKLEASAAELTTLKAKYAEDMAELDELRKLKAKAKAGDLYIKHQDDDDDKADMKKMTEKLGITLTEVDRELTPVRKLEVSCLKEFAETDSGEKSMQLAESLLDKGRLTTGGYLKAQKIDRLLDQAIRQAKILPKQRKAMYLLAIQDFDQVSALLTDAKPVLDLSTRGIEGTSETLKASEELEVMVVQYMKEKSVDRATALRDVTRKNPELWRRHTTQSATMVE